MTTIVGIQGDNFALVCSDSRISDVDDSGHVSQVMTLREGNSKIAVNGKYLFGAAGDLRAINILHHAFNPPTPTTNLKGKKLDEFMTVKFIPSLRECFEHQGYAVPESHEDKRHIAEQDSTIIVVVNGTIYVVDGDYSWYLDANGMYALGTGSAYALGALQSMLGSKKIKTAYQARTMALKALAIASRNDPHTGAPFHTYVQEQK
jgi:ATP-dependent protease HslVU (ClpYQ) peptidase subunit